MISTFADLDTRFAAIAGTSHVVTRKSAGAVGELFEELMAGGIVGNFAGADFAEIDTEAKVHYGRGPMTLFCFAFSHGVKPAEFSKAYGSGQVRVGRVNSKGHSLRVTDSAVEVTVDGRAVAGWSVADLLERIENKMPNLAMVDATKRGQSVVFNQMFVGKRIVAERFIEAIASGNVIVEMRSGAVQFRANPETVKGWFEASH